MVQHMWYTHFSVRNFLEQELDKRWQPHDRDAMRELADWLRRQFGPSYVIDQMYKKAADLWKDAIIESIRNIWEIDKLRQYDQFFLLWIDADKELRYHRIVKRWSSTDHVTYEEFCEQEDKEIHTQNPYEMNLVGCLALADVIIYNNWTVAQLYMEIERAFLE